MTLCFRGKGQHDGVGGTYTHEIYYDGYLDTFDRVKHKFDSRYSIPNGECGIYMEQEKIC